MAKDSRIDVRGFREDLESEYRRSQAVIVPVRWGAGTKIKVIEALAHARVPVVTRHVFSGYSDRLVPGRQLLVGETSAQFTQKCLEILGDDDSRHRMEDEGRETALRHYSHKAFIGSVSSTLERALQSSSF